MLDGQSLQALRCAPVRFVRRQGAVNPFRHCMESFICRQLNQVVGTFTLRAFFAAVNECLPALTAGPSFPRGVGLNIIMFAHHPFPDQLLTLGALTELLLLFFKQLVHIDAQHLKSHGGDIDIRWQPGT